MNDEGSRRRLPLPVAEENEMKIRVYARNLFALTLVAQAWGCSAGPGTDVDKQPEADRLGTAKQAIAATGSGGVYSTQCVNAGVPLPPPFGTSTVLGTGVYEYGKWTLNPEAKTLIGDPLNDRIKVYTTENNVNGTQGLCVIGAHYTIDVNQPGGMRPGFFDVICQGKNGMACFWEGASPMLPDPTATPLYINSLDGGTTLAPSHSQCTSCHAGKNAFIAHNGAADGLNGVNDAFHMHDWWMPTTDTYTPIVPAAWTQNPAPIAGGYPASCTNSSCHAVGGAAGAFPTLRTPEFNVGGGYCQLLSKIVFAPGTKGGMPPGSTCINENDPNCPARSDPAIQAMLDACGRPQPATAVSYKETPVGLSASGSAAPYAGSWDHALVGSAVYDVNKMYLFDNQYNSGSGNMNGWNGGTDYTSTLQSYYRPTMWARDNDGTKLSLASTDYSGQIKEKQFGTGGASRTVSNTILAAGSPYGFFRLADSKNVIVFRGTDNYIYQSEWSGTAWATPAQPPGQTVSALGDPIAYNRGTTSSIIYKCGLRICELRKNGSSWTFRSIPTSAPIRDGTMPVPFKRKDSSDYMIFYAAADGLHVITDAGEPTFGATPDALIQNSAGISSTPAPYDGQDSGVRVAYTLTPGGFANSYVLEAILPYGHAPDDRFNWTISTRATSHNGETIIGDPGAYQSTAMTRNTILFRNSANTVYQLRTDNSSMGDVHYSLSTIQKGYNINTTSSVAQNQEQSWSLYLPSGTYQFDLTPSAGDTDLYVSQSGPASTSNWSCRPYQSLTAAESCTVDVPLPNNGYVYVMVRGYSTGTSSFSLKGYFKD
jgi:hypothetical protein